MLEKRGWRHEVVEERNFIRFGFATENYMDSKGKSGVLLIAEVMDDGASWQVFAPNVYHYEDGPHGLEMLKACLYAARGCKFATWTLDIEDGEIILAVRSILNDAPLTESVFQKVVDHIVWAVESFHDMITRARDTGEIRPPSRESPLEGLFRRIAELSPASREKVRAALDSAITKAAETASEPETL